MHPFYDPERDRLLRQIHREQTLAHFQRRQPEIAEMLTALSGHGQLEDVVDLN